MVTKSIAWNTGSGNITLAYQGQGDGPISIQSDANNLGSARSQVITVETTNGAVTRGFTVSQAACPFPVGDVKNFSYTGSYQEVELPAGQYKLQCWGAQGGSNAAASSYSITSKAGGKGGYAEGVITLSQKTTVRVYVGGQGSSSAGGFNGGGNTTGSATYNSGNEQGVSRMGGGGGATDIRLSDGALLSRMIVAGGGAGGAMCYQKKTTTTIVWTTVASGSSGSQVTQPYYNYKRAISDFFVDISKTYRTKATLIASHGTSHGCRVYFNNSSNAVLGYTDLSYGSYTTLSFPSGTVKINIESFDGNGQVSGEPDDFSVIVQRQDSSSSTTTSNESQVGGVGGGTQGGGYSSSYVGKQNAAGSGGSFGQGANMTTTNYRYCSGAGGGGWYGGGTTYSDNGTTSCKYGGGGSGFVNTAASAGNRPSGYTGLELDSGTTIDGAHSFEAPGGGTETGHSGNGHIRITRLA